MTSKRKKSSRKSGKTSASTSAQIQPDRFLVIEAMVGEMLDTSGIPQMHQVASTCLGRPAPRHRNTTYGNSFERLAVLVRTHRELEEAYKDVAERAAQGRPLTNLEYQGFIALKMAEVPMAWPLKIVNSLRRAV